MMELDKENNLKQWPLDGLEEFIETCRDKGVQEINLTGTNTDPMLYRHLHKLVPLLKETGFKVGCRTNGVQVIPKAEVWALFDKASISLPSFDPKVYKQCMGNGTPPDLNEILHRTKFPLKVNVVLSPVHLTVTDGYYKTHLELVLNTLAWKGIKKVNVREPYGQPHIGDPMPSLGATFKKWVYGMPCYDWRGMEVTYWDVHYVEVESVNLYANGRISIDYPITRGHADTGVVLAQENFQKHGRVREQWVK